MRCEDRKPGMGFDAIPNAIVALRGVIDVVELVRDPAATTPMRGALTYDDGFVLRVTGGDSQARLRAMNQAIPKDMKVSYTRVASDVSVGDYDTLEIREFPTDQALSLCTSLAEACQEWNWVAFGTQR